MSTTPFTIEERQQLVIEFVEAKRIPVQQLLENKNCPVYVLRHYEELPFDWENPQWSYETKCALAKNSNASSSWLERFYRCEESPSTQKDSVAMNPSAPRWILEEVFQLATRGGGLSESEEWLCSALAMNSKIDPQMLQHLKRHDSWRIRVGATRNSQLTSKELVEIVKNDSSEPRRIALENPNLTRDDIISNGFMEDERYGVKASVSRNPNLEERDLLTLLGDMSHVKDMPRNEIERSAELNHARDIAMNPASTENVHFRIIEWFEPFIREGGLSSPYLTLWDRDSTNAIPPAIAEELIVEYGESCVLSRVGTPGSILVEYATNGSCLEKRSAWRNPELPALMFAEPEKNPAIVETVEQSWAK